MNRPSLNPAAEKHSQFLLTTTEKLSPSSRAVLSLKVLMGGLCRSALLDVLKTAEIPPPTGCVWTQSALRATEHTLSGLHLLDSAGAPVPGLEPEACYAVELPFVFAAFSTVLQQKEQGAHRMEPLRLGLRLAVFANDVRAFQSIRSRFTTLLDWNSGLFRPLKNQFMEPLPPQWWSTRHPLFRAEIFMEHAARWMNGICAPSFDMELDWFRTAPDTEFFQLVHTAGETGEAGLQALIALALSGASARLKGLPDSGELPATHFGSILALGVAAFCEGEFAPARKLLEDGRKRLRQACGRRTLHLSGVEGLCLGLCLLCSRDRKQADELEKLLRAMKKTEGVQRGLHALTALLYLSRGDVNAAAFELRLCFTPGETPFEDVLFYAALQWADPETALKRHAEFAAVFEKHRTMLVPARMLAVLLERNAPNPLPYTRWIETCPVPAPDILALLGGSSVWERRLETLEHLLRGDNAPATPAAQRLVWLLDTSLPLLTPLQQSPKGAGWTTGRPVALKRLHEAGPEQAWITPQDRRIIATIEWRPNWSGGLHGEFNMPRALDELVGHPCILNAISREPLTLSREDVTLEVHETPSGYELALSLPPTAPLLSQNANTPGAWICHHVPLSLRPILPSLSEQPLRIPKTGAGRIMDFVSACAPHVPLRTNLSTGSIEASPRPVIRLSPASGSTGGSGLRAEFLVRPFGTPVTAGTPGTATPDSPAFPPGSGPPSPLFRLDGRLVHAHRDMNAEREALHRLLALCPTLASEVMEPDEGASSENNPAANPPSGTANAARSGELLATSCTLDTTASALQALLELQQATEGLPEDQRPVLEWPLGQHFRVIPSPTADRLTLRARKAGDWFRLEGQATLQDDLHAESRVLEMSELLARLDQSSGLFVPLGNGEFLALTRQLRRRLERLRRLTEQDRDHSRRIHPLAAGAVDDLFAESQSEASIETDAAWQEGIRLLRASEGLTPELPSTLKADLRDYQLEGFQWLSRLARLNAGACLADDMGLGKTVQTLAALLEQAPHGPCLVVAPMSVCHNWEAEAARFAPTLNIHRLGLASDRAALILSLGPGDVLVLSYNLLQIEEAALTTPFWRMIVFDEAQALKNPATKRAKSARNLRAGFRVALTGTPIENQLEDLWSLFHILNPGLLGTLMSFRKRFSTIGATSGNSGNPAQDASLSTPREDRNPAKVALKAMVRPFILRRTKTAVLTELPPRTEQVLTVELPPDERALYEALRRKALEQIEALNAVHAGSDAASGQRRLAILGELTRLRRACCHPALIDPQTPLPGAKLEAFLDLVRELRQGRHKALVFSQFVGHLHIVREALLGLGARPGTPTGTPSEPAPLSSRTTDAETSLSGMVYQYLDGSTPERERQRAVRAFQDGCGDLFLISLKAGGQGLNLTAADYVIHLDPWWNPAVEDQASDRAHRMGQERPVTIYRLVTGDTVEEKILDLHHAKRALAADFLSGAEAPLSETELIKLFV